MTALESRLAPEPQRRSGASRWLAPLLIAVILFSAAYHEHTIRPIEFWNSGLWDYPDLSLAHALNIDFWLSEAPFFNGRQISYHNMMHPGFPFQLTSWIGYRMANFGMDSGASDRCVRTLADPSVFWLATRLIAIGISLACAALYASMASRLGVLYSMAVGLSFFCYEGAWDYSIGILSNETFALPLALAVVFVAGRSLALQGGKSALTWWAAWGALCALCWLNKLNYVAWTAAAVPAWGFYLFARRPSFANLGMQLMAFGSGFLAAAYLLARLFLGAGGLRHVLILHRDVLTHAGAYGTGSSEVVSKVAVWMALQSLMAFWPFLLLAGAIFALSVWVVYSLIRQGKAATSNAALLVYLLSAAGLFFAAVLKHYGPHYLIAGVPAISLLLLMVGEHLPMKVRSIVSVGVGLAFVTSFVSFAKFSEERYRHEEAVKKGLHTLHELRRGSDDAVLWTYRVPDRHFCLDLLLTYTGIPEVTDIIEKKFSSPDLVYYPWDAKVKVRADFVPFEDAKWRYAAFDKPFYAGYPAEARTFFETQCWRIIDEPAVCVFERREP